MNLVIGSGPAGIAAAFALLDRGQPVTLIDAGVALETHRQTALDRLRAQIPSAWDPEDLALFRENRSADTGGIPLKRAYGSDYAFRGAERYFAPGSDRFRLLMSFAKGGLSTVWGGAVLPYSQAELSDWPVSASELAPHYQKVLARIPFSARHDALERQFPLYAEPSGFLNLSRQAGAFLADLQPYAQALAQAGLIFGAARLAVGTRDGSPDCVYCGMCLYGCPYGLIYNAAQTLPQLTQDTRFSYRSGIVIDQIVETAGGVELSGHAANGTAVKLAGARVFLGGGVLSSARILLRSGLPPSATLRAQTSQHFILPLLRWRATAQVSQESLHTLAQAFLEYLDTESVQNNVHMQIYSYNDLYAQAIAGRFGRFARGLSGLLERRLLSRLLIVQGYLHSAYSPRLEIRLDADGERLRVVPRLHQESRPRVRRAALRLARQSRRLRAVPLLPMLHTSGPGEGAHLGGTFPMRRQPAALESNVLGVPTGFRRTHLIDASGFPDIPPTTITLTIMANAHRIATHA
jgi:choline dehydrogenase-like flavoprotein